MGVVHARSKLKFALKIFNLRLWAKERTDKRGGGRTCVFNRQRQFLVPVEQVD